MDTQEFSAELTKLSPKNGDLIFVDEHAVNMDLIAQMESPSPDQDDVTFIAIHVPNGKTVRDVVFSMSRAELEALLNPQS